MNQEKNKLLEKNIPKQYQRHWKVFSKIKAKRLPPTQEENMSITFKEDAPQQLDCRIYPLGKKKTEVLHQALNDNLAKGYVHHGMFSYISSIFFISKKDGKELHMINGLNP